MCRKIFLKLSTKHCIFVFCAVFCLHHGNRYYNNRIVEVLKTSVWLIMGMILDRFNNCFTFYFIVVISQTVKLHRQKNIDSTTAIVYY